MTRFVLVSFLPVTISYTIKRVREHFEPGVNEKILPHISLTYPFWSKISEKEISKKVKPNINQFQPFLTTISAVKTFSQPSHSGGVKGKLVIYLSVLPSEPFTKLHKKMQEILIDNITFDTRAFVNHKLPDQYIPHITLAMNADLKDWAEAKKMAGSALGYSFMIEKISLLKKEEGSEIWQPVSEFNL